MAKPFTIALMLMLFAVAFTPLAVQSKPAQAHLWAPMPLSCEAVNVYGTVTITGNYTVDGSPYLGAHSFTWGVGDPHTVHMASGDSVTVTWQLSGIVQTVILMSPIPECATFTNIGDYSGSGFCATLPPIPLLQLENGCVIPAIVNTYAYVIGIEWLFGIIAAVISSMIYLKSESTWLVLIVNVCLMPVCAFLLPAQLSGLIYSVFVVAIAGLGYLLIRG
jgi:hypothetical protein